MAITRDQFRFFHRLRVRWSEVDAQKIVFNPNYLVYFDLANTEYWRELGMPYPDALAEHGGDVFLRKASVEFLASARFDELLDVGARCAAIGTSSMTFAYAAFRDEVALAGGELVYVFAHPTEQRSMRVPDPIRARIQAFEGT